MLKSGVKLEEWCQVIKNQLSNLSYYDEWAKLALHRPIWDLGQRVRHAYPNLDPKILSKFERWKEEVLKVSPFFQIGSKCTVG